MTSILYDGRPESLRKRASVAQQAHDRAHPDHVSNTDEEVHPQGSANFTKGLEHDPVTGEVADPKDHRAFVAALLTGQVDRLDALPAVKGVTKQRPFVNPQAGLAFDLEGPDARAVTMPPAPAFSSEETAAEAVELYWMALLRDVAFPDYATNADAQDAATELTGLNAFRGPRVGSAVTHDTLFRGNVPGATVGPYVSQFLLLDVPFGTLLTSQRQTTASPGVDWMTTWPDWLEVQNGEDTSGRDQFDMVPRYIRNGRDLATYVHFDGLYEAYLNACLILLAGGAPFDPGNPYADTPRQTGFGTFGGPHVLSLVCEVATRALKAVWHQKWFVHRRIRPEAFGGRVHRNIANGGTYPIASTVTGSQAVARTQTRHGSALLPMAFPEGSPMHPSYGAGHATVAGACVTILKAWFDERYSMSDLRLGARPGQVGTPLGSPQVPDPAGANLIDWTGGDVLTVGGELNKLAANISVGRNIGGVHWYSDFAESVRLGEEVAIRLMQEQQATYPERGTFSLTRFDGTRFMI